VRAYLTLGRVELSALVQNFNFEVSTPLIGPSTPSTIFPLTFALPSSFPAAALLEAPAAAVNRGLTPNEAQSNRYRALIFETKAVKSISAASGLFVVGNWLMRSMRILA